LSGAGIQLARKKQILIFLVLAQNAIRELAGIGLVPSQKDILVQDVQDIPCAYFIYDKHHSGNWKVILDYLDSIGISSIGRYGHWEYSGMEEAMQQGRETAEAIAKSF